MGKGHQNANTNSVKTILHCCSVRHVLLIEKKYLVGVGIPNNGQNGGENTETGQGESINDKSVACPWQGEDNGV